MEAIVLAGGRGLRLGGRDKAALALGGTSFLERAIDAVAGAERVIVVGPRREVPRDVVWARESPAGGGPVAGIDAGLSLVAADLVAVVAVDLPLLQPSHFDRLARAACGRDGAIFVDAGGRDQPLAGVYSTAAFRNALERLPATWGASVSAVVAALDLARITESRAVRDCDTPEDVAAVGAE